PSAGRDEVRAEAIRLLELLDIFLVRGRRMRGRIVVRGHDTEHDVALPGKLVIVGQITRADDLDVGLVEPTLNELARKGAALLSGEIDEGGIRREIANALQERCEIRISERHLQLLDHLPA